MILYKTEVEIPFDAILTLYTDANWTAYTKNPVLLQQAIQQSLFVLTAWHDQQLIGLLRAVGDGLTILYIQDIIVLKTHQRQGIGKQLIVQTLARYKDVRQVLLLTDNKIETVGFYEACGMQQTESIGLTSFVRILK